MSAHKEAVSDNLGLLPQLEHIILLSDQAVTTIIGVKSRSYSVFALEGRTVDDAVLQQAESRVSSSDVLNLQFTSGKHACE